MNKVIKYLYAIDASLLLPEHVYTNTSERMLVFVQNRDGTGTVKVK